MPITIAEIVQIVIEIVKMKDEETAARKAAEEEVAILKERLKNGEKSGQN